MKVNKFLKVLGMTLAVSCSMSQISYAQTDESHSIAQESFQPVTFEVNELHVQVEGSDDEGGHTEVTYIENNAIDGTQGVKATYGIGNWPGMMLKPGEGQANWNLAENGKILAFDV